MRTDLDACDCTQWLCEHCARVCAESQLWEENPLPPWGIEPLSVLHQAFRSDVLIPTELPCPYCVSQYSWKTTGINVSTHGKQQGCPHGLPSCCQRHSLNCEWRRKKERKSVWLYNRTGVGGGCFGGTGWQT